MIALLYQPHLFTDHSASSQETAFVFAPATFHGNKGVKEEPGVWDSHEAGTSVNEGKIKVASD